MHGPVYIYIRTTHSRVKRPIIISFGFIKYYCNSIYGLYFVVPTKTVSRMRSKCIHFILFFAPLELFENRLKIN